LVWTSPSYATPTKRACHRPESQRHWMVADQDLENQVEIMVGKVVEKMVGAKEKAEKTKGRAKEAVKTKARVVKTKARVVKTKAKEAKTKEAKEAKTKEESRFHGS